MLQSRFFFPVKIFNRYLFSNLYQRQARPQPTKLQFRILDTKNFNDFYKIFDENRSQFTPELYSFCNKTLANIIYKNKEYINNQQANNFLQSLSQVQLKSINQRNIINILNIFRNFKSKKINLNPYRNFLNLLTQKLSELYKQKVVKQEDLGQLMNAHYELSHFRTTVKVVADKIFLLLSQSKKADEIKINTSQLTFFLHSLSQRQQLSKTQVKIRSLLLQKVKKQLDILKIEDIVSIAISLNKMDISNFQGYEFSIFKNIINRIIENLTDLDEKSVFKLIKSQSFNKFTGFNRIYQEIIHSILAQINEKGQSNIGVQSIFKIFYYLSSKVNTNKLDPKQKLKLFAFLQKYARQTEANQKYQLANHIDQLIKNDFFDKTQKKTLLSIFQKYQLLPNLKLIYYFSIKSYPLQQFVPFLLTLQIDKLRNIQKYRLSIIINILKSQNKQIIAIGQKISNLLAENYYAPQKFIQFYKQIKREKQNLHFIQFHEAHSALFSRLPNPFQERSDFALYRQYYLDYVSLFLRSRDYSAFIQKYQTQIKIQQVINLIKNHIQYQDRRKIQPQIQFINLLNKRFNLIIQSKNKKYIEVIFDLVNKYNRFAIQKSLPYSAERNLFRIIHYLISNLEVIKQLELLTYFGSILQKYLTKNHYNYNIQYHYRNLLRHLIPNIPTLSAKTKVYRNIIQQGLRLNILTRQDIQKLVDLDINQLSYYVKLQISYLKDSKYLPELTQLNQNSLKVVLSNHNFQNYIKENQTKILDLLQNSNIFDLQRYVISFNQPKTKTSFKILNHILRAIIKKESNLERIDFTGIVNCALDKNYFFLSGYRQLAQKIIESIKQKISTISYETHTELIKFFATQSELKAQHYYSALIKSIEQNKEISQSIRQSIYTKLASTSYEFKQSQINLASNIIQKNIFRGTYYFLMLQNKFEPSQKSALVKQISENINQTLKTVQKKSDGEEKIKTFPKIFYAYLKSKYPIQTESLTLSDQNLSEYIFSQKPKTIYLLEQIAKIVQSQIQYINNFGENNHIIRIKNYAFIHIVGRKAGATYQLQFLKRAICQILGQQIIVTLIYKSSASQNLGLIVQQCQGLLNSQQVSELKVQINDRKLKYQQKALEEQQQI